MEHDIRAIESEEKKVHKSVKELVKKGDKASAKKLCLELIKSKKAKERMYSSRATLNSISMQLQNQLSMLRVSGTLQKSAQIMEMMNNVVKMPQLQGIIIAMGNEMSKAGIIEEMMSDALDEGDEIEEEAESEVEKVLLEITSETLGKGKNAPQTQLQPLPEEEEEKDGELSARLAALRS